MKTYMVVFLVISALLTVLSELFRIKAISKHKKIIDILRDISYIVSILLEIFTYSGEVQARKTVFIIISSLSVIAVVVMDFYQWVRKMEIDGKKVLILHSVVYALLIASIKVLHGFNFLELIVFSAFAILFYLSSYFLKRKDETKSISIFFLYTILISYLMGSSFTPVLISDTESGALQIIMMFIGSLLMFISSMFLDGDVIFSEKRKRSIALSTMLKILQEVSILFVIVSILMVH